MRIQPFFSALMVKADGRLRFLDRAGYDAAVARLGDGEEVEMNLAPAARQRTVQQNRFWHAVVIPLFSDHCGYDFDEMKDALSLKLIPVTVRDLDGEERIVPGHTSDLKTKEFNDLIERAQRLGAEMGIVIPDPDPAWREHREGKAA